MCLVISVQVTCAVVLFNDSFYGLIVRVCSLLCLDSPWKRKEKKFLIINCFTNVFYLWKFRWMITFKSVLFIWLQ